MEEQKQGGPSSFSCAIINARRHLEPGVQVLEGNLFFGLRKVSRGREWGITVCRETFPRRQSVPEISKAGAWRGRGCGRRRAAGVSPSSRDLGGEKKAEVSTEWTAAFEAREQNEPVGQRGGRGLGGPQKSDGHQLQAPAAPPQRSQRREATLRQDCGCRREQRVLRPWAGGGRL